MLNVSDSQQVVRQLLRVGIDIGATFTDLIAVDATGEITNIKIPTTPYNPESGVLNAFETFLRAHRKQQIEFITRSIERSARRSGKAFIVKDGMCKYVPKELLLEGFWEWVLLRS
jgi:activator of 2-hydroxyglutaryl-CoA dehydratase